MNHVLTPEVAFVSLTLFNMLRYSMTHLPSLITKQIEVQFLTHIRCSLSEPLLTQLQVSNKRLKEFLAAEELDETIVRHDQNVGENFLSSLRRLHS